MISAKKTISLFSFATIIGFASLSMNSFAQNSSGNMPNSNSFLAQDQNACASTCSTTRGCASWKFTPYPSENGISRGGICEFSNTPINTNTRVQPQNNVQSVPHWGAQNRTQTVPHWDNSRRTGGNYQVTPLPNYNSAQPKQTYAPPPQGMAQPQNQGGAVSFERPQQTYQQAPKPMSAPNAQYSQTPQYAPAPVQQFAPAPVQQYAPAPSYQAPQANLNQYRAADGTIDAAEMRRNQMKAQNNQNTPRYSVQSEWNEVARAEANGQNQPYDLSNTVPVANNYNNSNNNYYNNLQNTEQVEPKRRLFGLLPPKAPKDLENSNTTEKQSLSALHGPLRKRNIN